MATLFANEQTIQKKTAARLAINDVATLARRPTSKIVHPPRERIRGKGLFALLQVGQCRQTKIHVT